MGGNTVEHRKWTDYQRDLEWGPLYEPDGTLHLAKADVFRYHRGTYPWIESDDLSGHGVRVPGGQGSPWHAVQVDYIYVGVKGVAHFSVGDDQYRLGPLDILMMPAKTPYSYTNWELSEAVFFDLGPRRYGLGPTNYFEAAPGEVAEARRPQHTPWEQYRSKLQWSDGTKWGGHHGTYPPVDSALVRAQMRRIPAGQRTPEGADGTETFLLGMLGECEAVTSAGSFSLTPLDLVLIPKNTNYRLSNMGLSDALVMSMARRPGM